MKRGFVIPLVPLSAGGLAAGILGIIFSANPASFVCSVAAAACSAVVLAFSIVLLCLLHR